VTVGRSNWRRDKRAIAETREYDGRGVLHVIGWIGQRTCGCYWAIGMRMDKHETTFGAGACEQHGAQVARALDAFQHMPPQAQEAGEQFQELLEHELAEPWAAMA
jgi:hypothetical protein